MNKNNYHTHTARCYHASGKDEEYVKAAIKAGIKELGFSDHTPWHYDSSFKATMRMPESQLDDYIESIRYLKEKYKDRILLIGKVDINTCPSLYDKADIMFLPTLLECFSASYPEAMKMGKPILTSDLSFAHSLCGDAALYFDPLSPQSIVEAIQRINVDKILVSVLIENGRKQLHVYDNAEQRCDKIIKLLEKIYCNK